MAICERDHAGTVRHIVTQEIDESQSFANGRHSCAACAYERGLADGAAVARGQLLQIFDDFTSTLLTEFQSVRVGLNTFVDTIDKTVRATRTAMGLKP